MVDFFIIIEKFVRIVFLGFIGYGISRVFVKALIKISTINYLEKWSKNEKNKK